MNAEEPLPPVHATELLLPWYVSGQLTEAEHRDVDTHLAQCESCRRELAQLTALRADYRAALAAEPGPAPVVRTRMLAGLRSPFRPSWVAVAASVLIVVQFAALSWLLLRPTTPGGVTSRAVTQPATRLRIIFVATTPQSQIVAALRALSGRIVDGPDAAGAYLIEVAPASPTDLARQLQALRAQPNLISDLELASP